MTTPTPCSLDTLATTPALAAQLSQSERAAAALKCATVLAALAGSMVRDPEPLPQPGASAERDRLLTVKEVAERMGCSEDYVYRNKRQLPFYRPLGRKVTFSARQLDEFLARRSPT
jgi:excisionase family DNA binding protein